MANINERIVNLSTGFYSFSFIAFSTKKKKVKTIGTKYSEFLKELSICVSKILRELPEKDLAALSQFVYGTKRIFTLPIPTNHEGVVGKFFSPMSFHEGKPESLGISFNQKDLNVEEIAKKVMDEYLLHANLGDKRATIKTFVKKYMKEDETWAEMKKRIKKIEEISSLKKSNEYLLAQFENKAEFDKTIQKWISFGDGYRTKFPFKTCNHESLQVKQANGTFLTIGCQCGLLAQLDIETDKIELLNIPPKTALNPTFEEMEQVIATMKEKVAESSRFYENALKIREAFEASSKIAEKIKCHQKICEETKATGSKPETHALIHISNTWFSERSFPKKREEETTEKWFKRCKIGGIEKYVQNLEPIVDKMINHIEEVSSTLDKLNAENEQKIQNALKEAVPEWLNAKGVLFVKKVVLDVLSFVGKMDGGFGITTYVDVLHGANSQKMRDYRLDKNPSYGMLREHKKVEVQALLEELMKRGLTQKVGYDYPKYVLTQKGKSAIAHVTSSEDEHEAKKKAILSMSFEQFSKRVGDVSIPKEWKEEYVTSFMKKNGVKGYRDILEALKTTKNEQDADALESFLVMFYEPKYKPVLEFLVKTKKSSLLTERLRKVMKSKGEKAC